MNMEGDTTPTGAVRTTNKFRGIARSMNNWLVLFFENGTF